MPDLDPEAQRRKSIRRQIKSKEDSLRQIRSGPGASPDQRKQTLLRRDNIRIQIDQLRRRSHAASVRRENVIEVAKLEKMVQAEVAADKWWHDMSPREQKAYIKAHPRSKFARNARGDRG